MDYEIAIESLMQDDIAFADFCLEAYMCELESALETDYALAEAMESVGKDSIEVFTTYHKQLSATRKKMNAAKKSKDYKTAAKRARECAAIGKKMAKACDSIPPDIHAGSLMRIALTIVAIIAAIIIGSKAGAKTGLGDKLANSKIGQKGQKAWGDAVHKHAMKTGKKAAAKNFDKAVGNSKKAFKSFTKGDFKGAKKAAGKAISHGKTAAVKGASTVGEGITYQKGFAARGQATRVMQKAGAAAGAGLAGGLTAGGSALASYVSKHKGKASEMNPNEKSVLFKLVKQDAKLIEKGYLKQAEYFDELAKAEPAKESFVDALESFSGMDFSSNVDVDTATEGDFNSILNSLYSD